MQRRWDDLVAVAEAQHAAFTTAQAAWVGVPRSTLNRWSTGRRVERVMRGAFAIPGLLDAWTAFAACCLTSPATLSHRAAGTWWRFDGVEGCSLEDTTVPDGRATRHLVGHRSTDLDPSNIVEDSCLRITDPARTLVDLGAVLDRLRLERAIECAVRNGQTTVSDLADLATRLARQGRSGPRAVIDVLEARPGDAATTGSDAEVRFLQLLDRAGVERPVRQYRVVLPNGTNAYLDAAWPAQRVFAEIDGYEWHGDWRAFQRDRTRQNGVVVLGWTPLRFTDADIRYRPRQVAATVRRALALAA